MPCALFYSTKELFSSLVISSGTPGYSPVSALWVRFTFHGVSVRSPLFILPLPSLCCMAFFLRPFFISFPTNSPHGCIWGECHLKKEWFWEKKRPARTWSRCVSDSEKVEYHNANHLPNRHCNSSLDLFKTGGVGGEGGTSERRPHGDISNIISFIFCTCLWSRPRSKKAILQPRWSKKHCGK